MTVCRYIFVLSRDKPPKHSDTTLNNDALCRVRQDGMLTQCQEPLSGGRKGEGWAVITDLGEFLKSAGFYSCPLGLELMTNSITWTNNIDTSRSIYPCMSISPGRYTGPCMSISPGRYTGPCSMSISPVGIPAPVCLSHLVGIPAVCLPHLVGI